MTQFFIRILLSLVIGWWIGVEVGWMFWPQSNLGPLLPILAAVTLTYLASFLIVPLFTGWLSRLR